MGGNVFGLHWRGRKHVRPSREAPMFLFFPIFLRGSLQNLLWAPFCPILEGFLIPARRLLGQSPALFRIKSETKSQAKNRCAINQKGRKKRKSARFSGCGGAGGGLGVAISAELCTLVSHAPAPPAEGAADSGKHASSVRGGVLKASRLRTK